MSSNPVYVQPVSSRRDLRAFLELPYRLHSSSEVWVPPLRIERRLFLNRRLNAYFTHGKAQEFVARRGDRVIGRISAQFDETFNATVRELDGVAAKPPLETMFDDVFRERPWHLTEQLAELKSRV